MAQQTLALCTASTPLDITQGDSSLEGRLDFLRGTWPEVICMGGSDDFYPPSFPHTCLPSPPSSDGGSCDLQDLLADFQSDQAAFEGPSVFPCSIQSPQGLNVAYSSSFTNCITQLSAQEVDAMLLDSEPASITQQQQQQAAGSGLVLYPPVPSAQAPISPSASLHSNSSSRTVTTQLLAAPQGPSAPAGCFNVQPAPQSAALPVVPSVYQPWPLSGSYDPMVPLKLASLELPTPSGPGTPVWGPADWASSPHTVPDMPLDAGAYPLAIPSEGECDSRLPDSAAAAAVWSVPPPAFNTFSPAPGHSSVCGMQPQPPAVVQLQLLLQQAALQQQQQQQQQQYMQEALKAHPGWYPLNSGPTGPSSSSSLPALSSPTGSGLSSHMTQQPVAQVMLAPQQQQQHLVQAVRAQVQVQKKKMMMKKKKSRKVRVADLMREQLRDQQQQTSKAAKQQLLHSLVAQVNGYTHRQQQLVQQQQQLEQHFQLMQQPAVWANTPDVMVPDAPQPSQQQQQLQPPVLAGTAAAAAAAAGLTYMGVGTTRPDCPGLKAFI